MSVLAASRGDIELLAPSKWDRFEGDAAPVRPLRSLPPSLPCEKTENHLEEVEEEEEMPLRLMGRSSSIEGGRRREALFHRRAT